MKKPSTTPRLQTANALSLRDLSKVTGGMIKADIVQRAWVGGDTCSPFADYHSA